MAPRTRVALLVAAAAAAATVVVVGGTLLQSEPEAASLTTPAGTRPRGAPPLLLDLGFRTDAQARALRRAQTLYDGGRRAEAGRIFGRFDALQAEIGAAFAAWPDRAVARMDAIVGAHGRSALARLHQGLALFWAGRPGEAVRAWRAALRVEPDSVSAVRADDLLHPDSPRGLPTFVPSFAAPARIRALPPERQLAALARDARAGGVRARLLYGVALQRVGRPRSAERIYAAAAALDRASVEAQVAAAVGRYRKGQPARAFALLGPLARRHPRDPSVRFHLGLLLLWLGEIDNARSQLELARAAGPGHPLGKEADRFLRRLESIRTR
jgi:tetratricopeptide (TPR) repeat protein